MALSAFAQSNPTPYSLASGNYSRNDFTATTTNPYAEWAFHIIGTQDPFLTTETTGDYTGVFNGGSGSRVNALGTNGFAFLNTGTSGFQGAAVLAINSSGRSNVQVSWTGGTVATGTRDYRIRLQYRVGTTGAFTDVLSGGLPVEYAANAAAGHSQTFTSVTLPSATENQSVVQLRWKYYYVSGTGARPQLRVDDVIVTSQPAAGTPTKLAITDIKPTSPTNTAPFSVTVTAQDATNSAKNVTSATNVTLSLATGTGTLGGTLTGTIPAGQSQITFTNVTYNTIENGVSITATRTSGDALTAGTSAQFNVQQGATQLAFVNFPSTGWTDFRLNTFTVEARKPNGTVDTTFSGTITLSQTSGTGLQGNLTRNAFRGVAIFNDTANVSFANPGTYTLQASSGNLTAATSTSVTITKTPLLTDMIIPQYIKSAGGGNRVPAFAMVRLDSLQPNTTYRYFSGASGPATSSASIGGGNNINYDATTGTYTYSINRSLTVSGGYSTFRTGANQRSMDLWLNLVPTTNAAFNPGTDIRWILSLGDSTGAQIARYLTTATSKAIDFGTTAATATGIADRMSMLMPKNFVLLYDSVAGTGRPLSTAIVQDEGAEVGAAALYYAELDGSPTAWATIIPNNIANGVRRIEERSWNGSLITVRTDADGIWNGVNTITPSSGLDAIYIQTPGIALIYPDSTNVCSTAPLDLRYYAQGIDSVSIQVSRDSGRTYQEIGRRSALDTSFSVPTALQTAGSQYTFRVIATQDGTIGDTSSVFAVSNPVVITRQPRSVNACEGSRVVLDAVAQGTGLTYQWQRDGIDIPGATNASLILDSAQQLQSGEYRVIINGTSPCPNVVSQSAVVFVNRPTRVVVQPQDRKTLAGGTVQLTAEFEITQPATYQWRRGGVVLTDNAKYSGTNSSILTIRNVQPSEVDETYTVTATGLCGSATSNPARVSISSVVLLGITPSPFACIGFAYQLGAGYLTTPNDLPVVFEWYYGSTRITNGAKYEIRENRLDFTNGLAASDTGIYTAIVRDPITGSADTATYNLSFINNQLNVISRQDDISICNGDTVNAAYGLAAPTNLRYTVIGPGGIVITDTLSSVTEFTVPIPNAQAGDYTITYSGCGTASSTFTVFTEAETEITASPTNVNTTAGQPLNLTVTATGSGTLTYQWFKNGSAISGATSATYSKQFASQDDAGTYTVIVTGFCGSDTSAGAVVVVGPNSVEGYIGAAGLQLEQTVPHPFADEASVAFSLPAHTRAVLVIRDVLGQTVQTINLGMRDAGTYTTTINASDIPAGTYYYTLQTDNANITRRFLIVR
jgi:hypothetical protein